MAVGMSSNAKALTANLDALCASATWPGDGLKLLSYDPFISYPPDDSGGPAGALFCRTGAAAGCSENLEVPCGA